jgi:hypothetical protein
LIVGIGSQWRGRHLETVPASARSLKGLVHLALRTKRAFSGVSQRRPMSDPHLSTDKISQSLLRFHTPRDI